MSEIINSILSLDVPLIFITFFIGFLFSVLTKKVQLDRITIIWLVLSSIPFTVGRIIAVSIAGVPSNPTGLPGIWYYTIYVIALIAGRKLWKG